MLIGTVKEMTLRMGRFLVVGLLLGPVTACAPTALYISAAEVDGLLAQSQEAGLSREQSTSLRALVEQSRERQRSLERHVREDGRKLTRLLKRSEVGSPALLAQASLVAQLRFERLLAPVLLREEMKSRLTDEQIEWFYRNRLTAVVPW
jgi:Spy/CpxP family protein refolding chaperone